MLTSIPKIMHFYWDGSKMSYLQYLTIYTFQKFNPKWKIIIHEPTIRQTHKTWLSDEQKIEYIGPDYYNDVKSLKNIMILKSNFNSIGFYEEVSEVFKSDFLRWYVLTKFGGGWSDFDILYLKSIDNLKYKDVADTITCIGDTGHIIGFFLSKPDNQIFKKILEETKNSFSEDEYQSIGANLLNKLYPTLDDLINTNPECKIMNLPMNIFYPINHLNIDNLFNNNNNSINDITDETIGVHWYNGSEQAKTFNNKYNPKKNNIKNTITDLIKMVL